MLYSAVSVDYITFRAVVLKFQEWDIDKKLSIQQNLQILEIKITKCCYSPYFHMTQNFLYDITLITTILKIVIRKFQFRHHIYIDIIKIMTQKSLLDTLQFIIDTII